MVLIFVVSGESDVSLPVGISDKVMHVFTYAVLAVLLTRAIVGGFRRPISLRAAVLAVACAVAYGATDEAHQYFVENRVADIQDLEADAAGACGGTALYWAWGILGSRSSARNGLSSHDH